MATVYRRGMEHLYTACIVIACACLVIITLAIPWGVFTRYVLNQGSSWPEPLSTLLMIPFTFLGAAAGYRANAHLAVTLFTDRLPADARRWAALAVEAAMGVLALFVIGWGTLLARATLGQVIAEFPWLPVGITYLPIPLGGLVTLLFIVERLWLGLPAEPVPADLEA